MKEDNVKKFWDNCSPQFAHLKMDGHLKSFSYVSSFWEQEFICKTDFRNKIVLDYGIGAGFLGEYLFAKYKLKYYYGVDISDRSLNEAKKRLHNNRNKTLIDTAQFYEKFEKQVDIIVCQACIQHFPSIDHLNAFLEKINNLKAQEIILQIAFSPKTRFAKNHYDTIEDVVRSCYTNLEYIEPYLYNYQSKSVGPVGARGMGKDYQYLIFKSKH